MCAIPWPQPLTCCPCGYAPEAMDEFVVRLRIARKRGVLLQLLGAGLLAITGAAWWFLRDIDGGAVMAVVSGSVTTIGGIGMFARGTQQVARMSHRLHVVGEMRQLPVARARQLPP